MSYLLEALGRGLLPDLRSAFDNQLPSEEEDSEALAARFARSPKSVDLAVRLGTAYLRQCRLRDAMVTFEKARSLDSAINLPVLGLACVYDELGQLPRALELLRQAQQQDAGDAALTFAVGFIEERLEHVERAVAQYERSAQLCPQLRNAYERLAALAIRRGEWDEAIRQYESLAEMEPDDLDTRLTLGGLYLEADRPLDAIDQYQNALFIEPECTDEEMPSAEKLADEDRLGETIQAVEKLVRKYPGVAPFHVQLGDLYVRAGQDTRAVEQYQAALTTQPSFLEATVKLGTQHMRQGRLVDAALTFNRAIELNDRLMTAFVGLGVAQHASGRSQESLATFDLAASLEPSTTLLFSESARLHVQSERRRDSDCLPEDNPKDALGHDEVLAEAIRRHQQALLNTPGHADLHYRYGLLLRQLGRTEEAVQALRAAVAINPNYSKAQIKLAICLKELGKADESIEVFQKALRLDPRFVDVHYQLGLLFAQRSQFELAAEQFEQAVEGNQRNLAFRANLALSLQNIGMVDRAAATWRSICELSRGDVDMMAVRERALKEAERGGD